MVLDMDIGQCCNEHHMVLFHSTDLRYNLLCTTSFFPATVARGEHEGIEGVETTPWDFPFVLESRTTHHHDTVLRVPSIYRVSWLHSQFVQGITVIAFTVNFVL
jgi:hypothetical protein